MKLTNLQLDVLVKTIYKKVEEKIKSLKGSSEWTTALVEAKKNINYSEKVDFAKNLKKLDDKIAKLKKERDAFYEGGLKIFDVSATYQINYEIRDLEIDLENEAVQILSKGLPSKEDIQADIVLHSVGGDGKDILTTLSTKYGV